jgi:hypothetical protein
VLGPVWLAQDVTPEVPLNPKVKIPVGATAPVDPATVAVKMTEPPRVMAPDELMDTAGAAFETRVVVDELTALMAL